MTMATCEPFDDQHLEFVYGLLDEGTAEAFRTHIETCPRCQQLLAGARGEQTLLARAAMPIGIQEVPAFSPPQEAEAGMATSRGEAPATLPLIAPAAAAASPAAQGSRRWAGRGRWLAAAVAASVLLAA